MTLAGDANIQSIAVFQLCISWHLLPLLSVFLVRLTPYKMARLTLALLLLLLFCLFRAAPAAYGGSQARGLIGATAAGLHNSHGSEPYLQSMPQLMAMLDP